MRVSVDVIMINKSRIIEQFFYFFTRLGKIVNKKKLQAEGFGKYFSLGSGKLETEVDLSDTVGPDENKSEDGVCYKMYAKIHPVYAISVICKRPI